MSAPGTLISKRVAFAEAVYLINMSQDWRYTGGPISRIEATLFSRPHDTVTGAQ